jgi:hypothetical protein
LNRSRVVFVPMPKLPCLHRPRRKGISYWMICMSNWKWRRALCVIWVRRWTDHDNFWGTLECLVGFLKQNNIVKTKIRYNLTYNCDVCIHDNYYFM